MAFGVDMEWAAIVMWATLGLVGCVLLLVAAGIGIATQFVTVKSDSDKAAVPSRR